MPDRDAARRLRLTTHEPLTGTRIGLTVWFGSVRAGWVGKQVAPWKWNRTWRISSVPTRADIPSKEEMLRGLDD